MTGKKLGIIVASVIITGVIGILLDVVLNVYSPPLYWGLGAVNLGIAAFVMGDSNNSRSR